MSRPPSVVVSAGSAEALELSGFLGLVARLAVTDAGREKIAAIVPFSERAPLERRRRCFEEVHPLLEEERLVPVVEESLLTLLERLRDVRSSLSGSDLLQVAGMLRLTGKATRRLSEAAESCPTLAELVAGVDDGGPLAHRISSVLDRKGRVRDDASPELAALRRQVREVRGGLYGDLQEIAGRWRDHLSEETISLRGGRLVLLLQSGARGKVKGLAHGRSATRKSFYLEPLEVVEANNRLQQAFEEEEEERKRILNRLIEEAREALPLLEDHLELLADLDLLQAAWRFASLSEGRLADIGKRHDLRLVEARHPLLDPRLATLREEALGQEGHTEPVVPLDLDLSGERRVLVVTGPNAGGKTVALKTVGLLAAANQAGLPVPAAPGTRLPFLRRLTASVGDEQDLLTEQSTFSARLLRMKEAWDGGADDLVLVDELGSGTDPEEGTALAVALMEGLLEKNCLALITTHLSRLAAAAMEASGARCAAMEFDPESGKPTFRMEPGAPGGSQALSLARRLGLPARWIERAEELLSPEHRDLRRLLREVERTRQELARQRQESEREAGEAKREREEVEREREELAGERRVLGQRLRRDLEVFRRKVSGQLREELARMGGEIGASRRRRLVSESTARLFEEAPEIEVEEPEEALPLEVEGRVRHAGLGWEGTLLKLEKGRAEVSVKGKRVRCRADELTAAGEGEAESGKPRTSRHAERLPDPGEVPAELKLIGRRVEPALEELESYLDRALLASRDEVRIIHGHGTGSLRDAVRELLRSHPAVADLRPGGRREGGDGATVARLKG